MHTHIHTYINNLHTQKEREFQIEHQVEDERIIDESKRGRIGIKESKNQLPFNSQDFISYTLT